MAKAAKTLMGAAKQRLTKSSYEARKAELASHLDAAWVAFRAAALQAETGAGSAEDRTAARATITAMEDSLTGLEAAWEEAQRQQREDAKSADAVARESTLSQLRDVFTKRLTAMAEIEKIIGGLGPHVAAYEEVSGTARNLMQRYFGTLGRDAWESFISDVDPAAAEIPEINGLLRAQGIDVSRLASFVKPHPGSALEVVERHCDDAYRVAKAILPDEDA
jgi:hypothetical protein